MGLLYLFVFCHTGMLSILLPLGLSEILQRLVRINECTIGRSLAWGSVIKMPSASISLVDIHVCTTLATLEMGLHACNHLHSSKVGNNIANLLQVPI